MCKFWINRQRREGEGRERQTDKQTEIHQREAIKGPGRDGFTVE